MSDWAETVGLPWLSRVQLVVARKICRRFGHRSAFEFRLGPVAFETCLRCGEVLGRATYDDILEGRARPNGGERR